MNWVYRITGVFVDFFYYCLFGMKICGRENLPESAPYILLANHRSMGDPFALAELYRKGMVHYMAKEELFRNRLLAWYLRKMQSFPVKRGQTDMAAMRTAMQVLRDGNVLGIFPEGTRHKDGEIGEIATGVAVMALKLKVPVVPVYLGGKYRIGGRLRVAVGKPLDLDALRERRPDAETLEEVCGLVRLSLEEQRKVASDEKNFQ